MSTPWTEAEYERYEFDEPPRYRFSVSRRAFMQTVGAGLLLTAVIRPEWVLGEPVPADALGGRFHIDEDGVITVFNGKVEVGQGARTQIAQATAEEFHTTADQIQVVMADTARTPDDGGTYGSLTTPRTVPTVRQAAAAARELLIELACETWGVSTAGAGMRGGAIVHPDGQRMSLAELVRARTAEGRGLEGRSGQGEPVPVASWQVLGTSPAKADAEAIVTGAHRYASDIRLPDMVYGAVLRPPAYGAELVNVDLEAARGIDGVEVVRDGDFVGCTASTSFHARKAIEALAASATWKHTPQPSSATLFHDLKANTIDGQGRSRARVTEDGDVDAALSRAHEIVRAEYHVPYIQHAPMETRSAVADWRDGTMTVWTGTQRPFDAAEDIARALGLASRQVRLIVPDTGGGFGGKHTPDAGVEAARLARAVGRPVALQWTREEEFTWAYFRPAGVIDIAAAIDDAGRITAWDFTNFNSGGSAIACPYAFPNRRVRFQPSASPLRQGSYRGLAATANNFAREAFIDQLARKVGEDPVAFRLKYLEEPRLRAVLEAAAKAYTPGSDDDEGRKRARGIACGTEKGSFVATCAEVAVDPDTGACTITRQWTAFECGAVQHPANLEAQIDGSVVQGLGAILSEAIEFEDGRITTADFRTYRVPRFKDLPEMATIVLNRPDLPSVGAGETPLITIAPAVANALYAATGAAPTALPFPNAG